MRPASNIFDLHLMCCYHARMSALINGTHKRRAIAHNDGLPSLGNRNRICFYSLSPFLGPACCLQRSSQRLSLPLFSLKKKVTSQETFLLEKCGK